MEGGLFQLISGNLLMSYYSVEHIFDFYMINTMFISVTNPSNEQRTQVASIWPLNHIESP